MTLAPFSRRNLMVGTEARMRVSSVIFWASSSGTLRSARTNTFFPFRSASPRVPTLLFVAITALHAAAAAAAAAPQEEKAKAEEKTTQPTKAVESAKWRTKDEGRSNEATEEGRGKSTTTAATQERKNKVMALVGRFETAMSG